MVVGSLDSVVLFFVLFLRLCLSVSPGGKVPPSGSGTMCTKESPELASSPSACAEGKGVKGAAGAAAELPSLGSIPEEDDYPAMSDDQVQSILCSYDASCLRDSTT